VSGISTEIFRQIETVENDHDATTAAALEAVERRGEMVVRMLDPRHMGRAAQETVKRFLTLQVNARFCLLLLLHTNHAFPSLSLHSRKKKLI
jgi:hypothetical protein